jgi:hypothetical protein
MAMFLVHDTMRQPHIAITMNDLPIVMGRFFSDCVDILPSASATVKMVRAMNRQENLTTLAAIAIYLLARELKEQAVPPGPPVGV